MLNPRLAIVTTALFTLTIGYLTGGSLELMTYAFAGSMIGMLKVRRGDRLASFAWGVLYIALVNLAAILSFRLPAGQWDWRGLLELSGGRSGQCTYRDDGHRSSPCTCSARFSASPLHYNCSRSRGPRTRCSGSSC